MVSKWPRTHNFCVLVVGVVAIRSAHHNYPRNGWQCAIKGESQAACWVFRTFSLRGGRNVPNVPNVPCSEQTSSGVGTFGTMFRKMWSALPSGRSLRSRVAM